MQRQDSNIFPLLSFYCYLNCVFFLFSNAIFLCSKNKNINITYKIRLIKKKTKKKYIKIKLNNKSLLGQEDTEVVRNRFVAHWDDTTVVYPLS